MIVIETYRQVGTEPDGTPKLAGEPTTTRIPGFLRAHVVVSLSDELSLLQETDQEDTKHSPYGNGVKAFGQRRMRHLSVYLSADPSMELVSGYVDADDDVLARIYARHCIKSLWRRFLAALGWD